VTIIFLTVLFYNGNKLPYPSQSHSNSELFLRFDELVANSYKFA